MELIVEQIIHKKYVGRKFLLDLAKHERLQENTQIIYFYSAIMEEINYPIKPGKTLYIGEACRKKSPTGERFKHIGPNLTTANDYTSNYTLTTFYELCKPINLQIYEVPKNNSRKELEEAFIRLHMKMFGAVPIAQGATGQNTTPKTINSLLQSYNGLEEYL